MKITFYKEEVLLQLCKSSEKPSEIMKSRHQNLIPKALVFRNIMSLFFGNFQKNSNKIATRWWFHTVETNSEVLISRSEVVRS